MSKPILLVQTAFLGDLVLTIPLLKQIRKIRPHAPIHLICRKGFGKWLKSLKIVDELHEVQKGNSESYSQLGQALSKVDFEWIFCPHPSIRSARLVLGLKAERKIGFFSWWNFLFFSDRVSRSRCPEPLRLLDLLSPLDREFKEKVQQWKTKDWNKSDPSGLLPQIPEDLQLGFRSQLLRSNSPIPIGDRTWALFPGSVWATKQWPPAHFISLAQLMIKNGDHIIWMGGKDEKDLCQSLVDAVPESQNLAGLTDLWESLLVLSRCAGVISNDSGGQHLAAVAGIPVVGIFGPTVLDFGFRPWSPKAAVAERTNLFCRPCGPHGNRYCPRGTHECLVNLEPRAVLESRKSLGS